MKLLGALLLGFANPIINIPSAVLASGDDSRGLNTSKLFRQERLEDYGDDSYEYENYPEYWDYDGDDSDYHEDNDLNGKDQGQRLTRFRSDDGYVDHGPSSLFWGQVFHIHKHYQEVVGVNWDEDRVKKKKKCIGPGGTCSSRHRCCKNQICNENNSCEKCRPKNLSCRAIKKCCDPDQKCLDNYCKYWCVDPGGTCGSGRRCCKHGVCENSSCVKCSEEDESCSKTQKCCHKDQKCVKGKCTDSCTWANDKGCPAKPCCSAELYNCYRGRCSTVITKCQLAIGGTCSDLYPCCARQHRCFGGKCDKCRHAWKPCTSKIDCCEGKNGRLPKCLNGICQP